MTHQQNHRSNLIAPESSDIPGNIRQIISAARVQKPDDLIRQVHEGALVQYHRTKREKQRELFPRIDEARRIGDRTAFKSAKKKVDNHASSVASRSRRAYLISSFEDVVGNKMQDIIQLAEAFVFQNAALFKKDAQLRSAALKISKLATENDSLRAQVSTSQQNMKSSPAALTQEGTWNGNALDAAVGQRDPTVSTSTDVPMDTLDEMALGELEEDEASFLDSVASQTRAAASNPDVVNYKLEASEWTLPAISQSVQAQMRADTPDDILYPAV